MSADPNAPVTKAAGGDTGPRLRQRYIRGALRDPFGLNERLFALYYPVVCGISERAGQRETRRELIGQASGRTLEIGAGSGLNLPHYTTAVTELVVTEPSPHMQAHLRRRLDTDPPPVGEWHLSQCGAEELPFDDASFDTVTATFVHCTIPDPRRALAEIARVLRPAGRYLFLEHVHAGDGSLLGRAQDLVEVPHRYVAAGCYPNRRTEELLAASSLTVEHLEHGAQPRAFPTVRPTILGSARRPS
jgi:SAM-dependent methyltransferase